MSGQKRKWFSSWIFSPTLVYAVRPAVAVVTSFFLARIFTLPEAYWAAVTTLVVTQSAPGTAMGIAGRRFIGTALGAVLAVTLALFLRPSIWVVGLGIFLFGVVFAMLGRVRPSAAKLFDRTTYRFCGITLTIILLIPRAVPIWVAALHRFLEVSIGIVVALGLAFLWPEQADEMAVK